MTWIMNNTREIPFHDFLWYIFYDTVMSISVSSEIIFSVKPYLKLYQRLLWI